MESMRAINAERDAGCAKAADDTLRIATDWMTRRMARFMTCFIDS